jgi:AMP deaminase
MIDNIFVPLFEVSRDPLSNPPLHCFLQTVVGFDCVDDESKPELQDANYVQTTEPCDYDRPENPPYSYWMYYLWANITSLNKYRQMRGLSVFSFRPHAGEAGDSSHLASCFMLADAINHGLQLRKAVVLQYLCVARPTTPALLLVLPLPNAPPPRLALS